MIELYINDLLVSGVDEIPLTKAANDLGDLPSRQGEVSITLDLPKNAGNLSALGHIENVNSQSRVPIQKNTYILYDTGMIISVGLVRVLSIKETIKIVLMGDNSDWVAALGDRMLTDLDVSDLNYSLRPENVEARRLNTSEMVLANVWYGEFLDVARPWDSGDFIPSLYIEYLVEKIMQSVGYSVNNLITAGLLYSKIVTVNSKFWMQKNTGIEVSFTVTPDDNGGANYGTTLVYLGGDVVKQVASTTTIVSGFPYTGKRGGPGFSGYDPPYTIRITVGTTYDRIAGYVDIQVDTTPGAGTEAFCYAQSPAITTYAEGTRVPITSTGEYRLPLDLLAVNVPGGIIGQPDTIEFFVQIANPSLGTIDYKIMGGEFTLYNKYAANSPQRYSPTYEYEASVQGVLPAIKQSDLLLTIFNQFGIITATNTLKREVTMVNIDQVIENIPNAEDWSEYVDLSEEPEILFDFFDNYFKVNEFIYKEDEVDPRIANTTYGNGSIDFDNELLQERGVIFESEFSAIRRSATYTGSTGKEVAQSEYRLYGDMNWKLGYVEITNDNLITQYGRSAPTQSAEVFFTDLEFDNLLANNYKYLQRIFANPIAIRILMKIPRYKYANLVFTDPIFIDVTTEKNGQIRGHFYINTIEQFVVGSGGSCYCILVKVD